ncbi:MAG: T9SS type A sorting domain-containing protein [Candidatus Kapaibacterium sp.]
MKNLFTITLFSFLLTANLFGSDKPIETQYTQFYDVLPDVSSCNTGILKQSVIDEVLDKVNHIRSLHKLKPVTYDYSGQQMSMDGCLNMVASGKGGHIDDPATPCYTPGGGEARMKSNIEYGSGSDSPIKSIVGWLIDDHNADVEGQFKVGHRRALLNPFLTRFAFGRSDGTPVSGGFFSASLFLYQDYTDASSINNDLEFIAYPYEYYPPSYVNKSFFLSFNAIADKNNLWGNQNVDYSSATVDMKDESGKVMNVHSLGNDNEGWGSFPNNISWKVEGLADNIKYTVNVKNVIVNGTSKDFTYWFELTDVNHNQPPSAPTLQVPENFAQSVKVNNGFSWSLTQNTSRYHLQVAEDEAFTKLVINKSDLTDNSYLPNELDYESTYWWRVASMNDAGKSDWSEIFTFSTSTTVPDRPYLAGPANNTVVNTTTPTLYWTSSVGAETYSLQVSRDDTFEGFAVRYTKSNLTDTFDIIPVGRLNNETEYWWRVKALNGAGESIFTQSWKFNTGIPLPAPQIVGPADGSETNLTPTLSWNVVPGASSYNVQLANRSEFDQGFIVNELSWEDVTYNIPDDLLEDGTTYYWRVKANSTSGSGPFTETLSFTAKNGTSVFDELFADGIEIYPNPANESIFVGVKNSNVEIQKIIVRNLIGNELLRFDSDNISDGTYLNLSEIPAGFYYIQIISNHGIINEKFTIVR